MKTMGFRKFITLSLSTVCALSLSSCFKDEPLNAECDIEQAYIHPGSWLKLWFTNVSDTLVNVQSDQDKIEFTMKPFASLKKQAPMFRLTPGATIQPESELFKVMTQIQDEVHRYAITFHRDKRSKHALHSELDDIKGIGPKAKEALLSKFKSVKKMKEASLEQLSEVLGPHKAEILSKYFEEKGENMK